MKRLDTLKCLKFFYLRSIETFDFPTLEKVMDTDDMDHVFFEARQINIALLNHITYNEFLPAVIGEANVNRFLQLRRVSI